MQKYQHLTLFPRNVSPKQECKRSNVPKRSTTRLLETCQDFTTFYEDSEAALSGHRGAVGTPDHRAPHARSRRREQLAGGYNRCRGRGDRDVEDGERSELLHPVEHLYTDTTVKDKTGPPLRARGRVVTGCGC